MIDISEDRARWLAECVLPHEPRLRSWLARRRIVDLEVDDIVQESYAVLAALPSVSHIRNPYTYLFSVAHSIILQHVRHKRIVAIETMADLEQLNLYSEETGPEEAVSDFQELRSIAQQIARLPDKCRMALVLRKVEGLSQRDIAARMRISESTVEKHIGKALRFLMTAAGEADAASPRVQDPARSERAKVEGHE